MFVMQTQCAFCDVGYEILKMKPECLRAVGRFIHVSFFWHVTPWSLVNMFSHQNFRGICLPHLHGSCYCWALSLEAGNFFQTFIPDYTVSRFRRTIFLSGRNQLYEQFQALDCETWPIFNILSPWTVHAEMLLWRHTNGLYRPLIAKETIWTYGGGNNRTGGITYKGASWCGPLTMHSCDDQIKEG